MTRISWLPALFLGIFANKEFGITGVSLWRIGNIPADGAYDVWSALLTQR